MSNKIQLVMRDLFGTQKQSNSRDEKLEVLMNEITELKNKINNLHSEQQKLKQIKLEPQETLEETILEEEITNSDNQHLTQELQNFEEDKYILLDEPEESEKNNITVSYKDPLEQEIVKNIAKNKKTIIKQKILAIASKQRTTSKQVKEFIVDKYKYCSKATFYRYLSELKRQHKLETISVNDREYVCNISISKRNNLF